MPENASPSCTPQEKQNVAEASNPTQAGETPALQRKRRRHYDFAAEHQFSFGMLARQLAPGDPALQDDLRQEMSLAVLRFKKKANFNFLFELASNRAKCTSDTKQGAGCCR